MIVPDIEPVGDRALLKNRREALVVVEAGIAFSYCEHEEEPLVALPVPAVIVTGEVHQRLMKVEIFLKVVFHEPRKIVGPSQADAVADAVGVSEGKVHRMKAACGTPGYPDLLGSDQGHHFLEKVGLIVVVALYSLLWGLLRGEPAFVINGLHTVEMKQARFELLPQHLDDPMVFKLAVSAWGCGKDKHRDSRMPELKDGHLSFEVGALPPV